MRTIVIVLALLCAGCEPPESEWSKQRAALRINEEKTESDNCLKQLGVVVRSSWDGRILECKGGRP